MIKNVTVSGLGLIGASMAKAIKKYTDCTVYGYNRTLSVTEQAVIDDTVDGVADDDILLNTDLLIVGMFPSSSIDYLKQIMPKLKKGCIVVDLVGVKTVLIDAVEDLAIENGINFIGGHPMAGLAVAGYDNATSELYQNASMILVPTKSTVVDTLPMMEDFFTKLGFGRIITCSKEEHDSMIAYTSQLAHIVSSAYIKSPNALTHHGYSAGSYKDMTRIACLNEHVWSELFLLNSKAIVKEIDIFMENMQDLKTAIEQNDKQELTELLKKGREIKEKVH